MIVVDASATLAMLLMEPTADACARAVQRADRRIISSVNFVEVGAVMAGRRRTGDRKQALGDVEAFFARFSIDIAPVTEEIAHAALEAFLRYGKGFGHPARLNLGDSFAYALAKTSDAALLFVGDDFAKTDVKSAMRRRRI